MKYLYTILTLFLFCSELSAQKISGVVTDASTNETLIGVNIILGDGSGTSTDLDGRYELNINSNKKITYKFIGYKDITKSISSKKNQVINIQLNPSAEQLSTVVVSAGKFEQKIEEITVSMEVIKPSLIENKNTTDIQTAMDQVPGVNITDGQANIRGGSGWSYGAGSRVMVLVDDMPLISGDAGQVQWKLIATENINQVEVIKGASSALYGSSALNGVINIRTAFPSQVDIDKNKLPGYTKVNMHYGLIDKAKREELNWNGDQRRSFRGIEFLQAMKFNQLDLSLGGNIFYDEGYRRGEITDRKRFNFNSSYKSKNIKGLLYGLNGNFLFQTAGSALVWDGFDRAYIPLNDEITTTSGDTYNVDPFITYFNGSNKHSLKTRYLKVINDNSTKGEDNNQDNESETFFSDYQWQKSIEEYGLNITTGTSNEVVYGRSDLFSGDNKRINNSLYAQLDKKYLRFNVSLGARYERFEINSEKKHIIDGDTINNFVASKPVFRTGINYQAAEATYLRASWGQGFRFPSMAELFIRATQSGLEIFPNPSLKPESGWSTEFGIKQGLKFGKWLGYLDAALFLMRYNDMMEFSFGQWEGGELGFKSVNVGKTEISGVEITASGQGKITSDLTINLLAGYTYMNPISLEPELVYETDGNGSPITYNTSSSDPSILKYRYQHIAKTDLEIIFKDMSFGTSLRYNDFMRNIDQIFVALGTDNGLLPGINTARDKFKNGDFIIDMRAGFQINKYTKIGLIVNNLLNREYMTRPATMMPPRTFALQCSLKI